MLKIIKEINTDPTFLFRKNIHWLETTLFTKALTLGGFVLLIDLSNDQALGINTTVYKKHATYKNK